MSRPGGAEAGPTGLPIGFRAGSKALGVGAAPGPALAGSTAGSIPGASVAPCTLHRLSAHPLEYPVP